MKFTLGKQERLKSKKLIKQLYKEGESIKVFPLYMIYLQTDHASNFNAQVGVSVSKKKFKNAVDRNRIKRLIRETYRKEKYTVYNVINKPYIYMISYLGKQQSTYANMEQKMKQLLISFAKKIKNVEN